MKNSLFILFFIILSCVSTPKNNNYRRDFTSSEKEIIQVSKELISKANFVTLISIDQNGQARARTMEFFQPDANFEIWMATNPKSRKVAQIQANSKVTLHYFDKTQLGYVSLMGNAYIVNDEATKSSKWKDGWEKFYPNKTTDYMLIRFVPETLEYIGILKGFTGDENTWAPHRVMLRD